MQAYTAFVSWTFDNEDDTMVLDVCGASESEAQEAARAEALGILTQDSEIFDVTVYPKRG